MKPETKNIWIHSMAATTVAIVLMLFGYFINHAALASELFIVVPFCTGLAIAFMSKGIKVVAITAITSIFLSLFVLIFSGLEGLGCVAMAFPLLFLAIGLGSLVGYQLGLKYIHRYGNITVIALCIGSMAFVGWNNNEMSEPKLIVVQSSIDFHAPMREVWKSVKESSSLQGDTRALKLLGLPIPYSCSLSEDGTRVCYFDQGQMIQKVTTDEFGRLFKVDIVESLEVRDWITFIDAGYEFTQYDGYVRVTRTDRIESTLRPRWYWHWFEEKCVQLEHEFVLKSMKQNAEKTIEVKTSK